MKYGKAVVLRANEEGFEISSYLAATQTEAEANIEDIKEPRWSHWRQRRLARIWQAVLLTMNIEPTVSARRALKQFKPADYTIYLDRLDIAKTLAEWDFAIYPDHLREGEGAGDKYVHIGEFCTFAQANGWDRLDTMRTGLEMMTNPPKPVTERSAKAADTNHSNSLLKLFLGTMVVLAADKLESQETLLAFKNQIMKGTEQAGCPLSAKTVERCLKEAADVLHMPLRAEPPPPAN